MDGLLCHFWASFSLAIFSAQSRLTQSYVEPPENTLFLAYKSWNIYSNLFMGSVSEPTSWQAPPPLVIHTTVMEPLLRAWHWASCWAHRSPRGSYLEGRQSHVHITALHWGKCLESAKMSFPRAWCLKVQESKVERGQIVRAPEKGHVGPDEKQQCQVLVEMESS